MIRLFAAVVLVCVALVLMSAGCSSESEPLPESVVDTFVEKLRADDDSRVDLIWPESVLALERDPALRLLGDSSVDVFSAAFRSDSPSQPVEDSFDRLASVTVVRGPAPSELTTSPATQYEFALGNTDGQWWIIYVAELPEE